MLLRAQIVRVVLGTGQFDWVATINTADALAFLLWVFLPRRLFRFSLAPFTP